MAAPPLGLRQRFAYALPAFALAVMYLPVYVLVPKFYTDTVGVDMGTVGAVLGSVRLLDAFLDPLVGVLSDRTRTRLGRRRPWIFLGSIPLALALAALLAPARDGAGATTSFAVSVFATFIFFATVAVPYESLGMELSDSYDERTRLLGLRDGISIVGILAAASAPGAISYLLGLTQDASGERAKFHVMAALYAPLLVVLCAVCALAVPERPLPATPPRRPWDRATIRSILGNRPFRLVLLAYFVNAIGSNLPGTLMPYYVADYLHSSHDVSVYLALYFTIGIVVLPGWIWLSRVIDKRATWLAAMAVNSGAFFLVAFLRPHDDLFYGLIVALSGIGFAATVAIPSSLQADVLDYDELLSGERREGLLLGFWLYARKLAAVLPVALALPLMKISGWHEGAGDQTAGAFHALKLFYVGVPTLCTAVAIAIAWRYPISRTVHGKIVAALDARKKGLDVPDPLA